MKIQPIIITYNNPYQNSAKNNSQKSLSFMGKYYPSGYYTDDEIKYATKSLHIEKWQDYVKSMQKKDVENRHGDFWQFFNYTQRYIQKNLLRVGKLRADLLNEDIDKKRTEQSKLFSQIINQAILAKTKFILSNKYITKISKDANNIPTAILISWSSKENRQNILKWICDQSKSKCRIEEYDCPDDIDKLMYYLETERDYSQSRFDKSKIRTIVKLNNFDKHLKDDNPQLKEFLSDISESKAPLTLIFETKDQKKLSSPFVGNSIRIPVKITMNSKLIEDEITTLLKLKPNKYDGFEYKTDKNRIVNLYLGGFGYFKNILWIDSDNPEDIKEVIRNIKVIKYFDKFEKVSVIQCPISDSSKISGMRPTSQYTKDFKQIYQYKLN